MSVPHLTLRMLSHYLSENLLLSNPQIKEGTAKDNRKHLELDDTEFATDQNFGNAKAVFRQKFIANMLK